MANGDHRMMRIPILQMLMAVSQMLTKLKGNAFIVDTFNDWVEVYTEQMRTLDNVEDIQQANDFLSKDVNFFSQQAEEYSRKYSAEKAAKADLQEELKELKASFKLLEESRDYWVKSSDNWYSKYIALRDAQK